MSRGNKKNSDSDSYVLLFQRITEAYRAIGITTQAGIARTLGLHKQKVQDWKVGKSRPTVFDLKEIAEVTAKPIAWFVGGPTPIVVREDSAPYGMPYGEDEIFKMFMDVMAEAIDTFKHKRRAISNVEDPAAFGGRKTK
jgi:hypothetical protein